MKNESPLSLKQERFCQEYVTTGNATQAYRAAGYNVSSDEAAAANASRLLRIDKVSARIAQLRGETEQELEITRERVVRTLGLIGFSTAMRPAERISALAQICKVLGYYAPEKVDTRVGYRHTDQPGAVSELHQFLEEMVAKEPIHKGGWDDRQEDPQTPPLEDHQPTSTDERTQL